MKVISGRFGSSCHCPPTAFAQRSSCTVGQELSPGSSGSPTWALSCCASFAVRCNVCWERRSATNPCIMCISTWQCTRKSPRSVYSLAPLCGRSQCSKPGGSSNTGGAWVSTIKDSAGPMLRRSIVSPANCQRWPCGWKLCQPIPRSRSNTYHRIRWPACARMVGLLPTKERPLKQKEGKLSPPRSTTLCWLGPLFIQVTRPPVPTVTLGRLNAKSTIVTVAVLGPPGSTVTEPAIIAP